MSYLKIEWFNSTDLGEVYYQDGFINRIYLDVELEKPDYNYTVESDLDNENHETPKFQKWEKAHKFEAWMQEDLVDAFTFMQMHDNIVVTTQQGDQITVDYMEVNYDWEEKGCLARVTVTFTEKYVVKGACLDNMDSGCHCDEYIEVYGAMPQIPFNSYAVEDRRWFVYNPGTSRVNKYYTGDVYYGDVAKDVWVLETNDIWTCLLINLDSQYYIYDGEYWQRSPGWLDISDTGTGTVDIFGWVPDGVFITLEYRVNAGAWTEIVTLAGSNLNTPPYNIYTDFVPGAYTTLEVRGNIWNHSCDNGYTEIEELPL